MIPVTVAHQAHHQMVRRTWGICEFHSLPFGHHTVEMQDPRALPQALYEYLEVGETFLQSSGSSAANIESICLIVCFCVAIST